MLNMIVKNETQNITRMLHSVKDHVHAISVDDTGSTDDTVELIQSFALVNDIPCQCIVAPFVNFGVSRTLALQRAQMFAQELKWDADLSYTMMMDADTEFRCSSSTGLAEFLKNDAVNANQFHCNHVHSDQATYPKTFLMRMDIEWTSVGSTHEYWSSNRGIEWTSVPDNMDIYEYDTGGSRHDKHERDVRFLQADYDNGSKGDSRVCYYLGRSLRHSKYFDRAEKILFERLTMTGWAEETVETGLELIQTYWDQNKPIPTTVLDACHNACLACPSRGDLPAMLARHYRCSSDFIMGRKWAEFGLVNTQPPRSKTKEFLNCMDMMGMNNPSRPVIGTNKLFATEHWIECVLFNEFVICTWRCDNCNEQIKEHQWNNAIRAGKHIMDVGCDGCALLAFQNMMYFIKPISSTAMTVLLDLDIKDNANGDYIPSSISVRPSPSSSNKKRTIGLNDHHLVNVRYVNYRIQSNGSYRMSLDGKLDGCNDVQTRNFAGKFNVLTNVITNLVEMVPETKATFSDVRIKGLEDVRLFLSRDGRMGCIAASLDYSHDKHIRQVIGEYDVNTGTIHNLVSVRPPQPTDCEKNWTPLLDQKSFIYKWYPLTIGTVQHNQFIVTKEIPTSKFFQRIRGSSNVIKHLGKLICIVHYVMDHQSPRKYFHLFVTMNAETYEIESLSLPFVFFKEQIEYCLGIFAKDDNRICAFVSENDANPKLIEMEWADIQQFKICKYERMIRVMNDMHLRMLELEKRLAIK